MLPTHGYPGLKKYPHFYGHFGTAWQNQTKEFSQFPGPFSSRQLPDESSTDLSGEYLYERCRQLAGDSSHFRPELQTGDRKGPCDARIFRRFRWQVGDGRFGGNTVMSVAGKVIEAVKNKEIRHFFPGGRV